MLSNSAEEILELLWIKSEEEKLPLIHVRDLTIPELDHETALEELRENGSIIMKNNKIKLTEKGRKEAKAIIRRHRLAERLLIDVLEADEDRVEEAACRFEHALPKGVDESVCTLLGHPTQCPHGNIIPPGRCCIEGRENVEKLISPLTSFEAGCDGRIAYITSKKHQRLQRLMAMGVIPGLTVKLIQSFPSYVIQIEETQIALDKDLAEDIYVRCEKN
jgi:DtxR family Mn-dependent transcriptional regulator